ncbi:hypothetical protein [Variovorax paradoxus]|uniref:hypothetical protein n=1 Tax=Variovorax paradoxus TaxID=34073 RepID=UPI0019330078|nr:hypothetical protein INQ48_04635 [Variovorax paradoxus]
MRSVDEGTPVDEAGGSATAPWRALEAAVAAFVLVAACAVIVYAVWSRNRGFEITDEAYYLLLAIHPAETRFYISAQQWATAPIWQLTGSLASFRMAGLVLLAGSAAVLGMGALAAARGLATPGRPPMSGRVAVIGGAVVCALLYAITINVSPSYNLLASAGAYLALGLVLLAGGKTSTVSRTALFGVAGVALAVEFVCKPSSGVATFVLVAVAVLWLDRSGGRKTVALATVVAGGSLGLAALLFSQSTPGEAVQAFSGGMALFRMVQSEPIFTRLARYAIEFGGYAADAMRANVFLIVAVLVYLIRTSRVTIALVIAAVGQTLLATRYFEYGMPQYIEYMQRALVFLALMLAVLWQAMPVRFRGLISVLALLPYTVAMGTGNALFGQVIISLASWGALMALAAYARPSASRDAAVPMAILVGFVALTSAQILVYKAKIPYNLNERMDRQSFPATIGPLGRVKVDAETVRFMQQVDAAVAKCRIAPGAPFLGLYNVPGLALALNAVPIDTPWLNNVAQADAVLSSNEAIVGNAVLAIRLNADASLPPLPVALKGFSANFEHCGDAVFPHEQQKIQIWSGLSRR